MMRTLGVPILQVNVDVEFDSAMAVFCFLVIIQLLFHDCNI